MFGGLDEWLDGSGWVWVVNLSRRGELGLEPYGSSLGWVARVEARGLGEVGSSVSVGDEIRIGLYGIGSEWLRVGLLREDWAAHVGPD